VYGLDAQTYNPKFPAPKTKGKPEFHLIVYKHSVTFKAPIKFVYDWCVDFQETDPELLGDNYRRIILEKSNKKVVYASYKPGQDGTQKLAVRFVTLSPSQKTPGIWIILLRKIWRRANTN
jgi:hypothetical protein